MPSIIKGYEYDLFVSYRQNDNKYDHWVSEFVSNLKLELEATVKDRLSIYFDENQEDGILETHNVDKSLSGKLKALIFIPIVSMTYCDPESFAWQQEFIPFKTLARGDSFGLDVRLANNNYASRILPVKIHEIDREDLRMLEKEMAGVLRSVDFIYQSAGVNRSLRPKDDDRQDNQSHSIYRNQINKVANAVKEIIAGIKHAASPLAERFTRKFYRRIGPGSDYAIHHCFSAGYHSLQGAFHPSVLHLPGLDLGRFKTQARRNGDHLT